MPEANQLLASSFANDINELSPVFEHEELRLKPQRAGNKSLETGRDTTRESAISFNDRDIEETNGGYGFFSMDEDGDFQGGQPEDQSHPVPEDTVSFSGSDSSTENHRLSYESSTMRDRRKKSLLKRGSAYGDANEGIPLDFERKEFNRVLPKPDLFLRSSVASSTPQKEIIRSGGRGMFRVSSEPVFVRPVYQSDEDVPKKENDQPVHSVPSSGFVEGALKKRISFGTIQIREHGVTIGDNPSCSYGTPVSLDWEHQDLEELKVEEYESFRTSRQRTKKEFYMNHFQRNNLLKLNGYSTNEIKQSKDLVRKFRNQRERTKFLALNYPKLVTVEDAIESGLRKVKRTITKSKANELDNAQNIPKKSSKDDLSLYDGISKEVILAEMDNDISNATAPF